MSIRAEIWTLPSSGTFERVIASPPWESVTATKRLSGVGEGTFAVSAAFPELDQILYRDTANPANDVETLLRLFIDDPLPVYELVVTDFPDVLTDDLLQISLRGIESLIADAIVEDWDWDGSASFTNTFPNWIYGGNNLLSNPGFEESTCRPEVNTIEITATSGSFFIELDGNVTGSIDTNTVTAFIIETEMEDPLNGPLADDVSVTGTGTAADPFVIEFVTPCVPTGAPITVLEDPGDPWVGGIVDTFRTGFGALMPNPWTKSQVVSSGTPRIFGEYTSFRVTTAQAHSGTFSLLIDPATIGRRFAGAQQVVTVKPGGLYQASVWVRTASASQQYRLVIRGIDEDILKDQNGNDALVQATLTANTWTQLSIPNVVVESDTKVIFRIANINVTGNPAIFYVDDGEFNEGMAEATPGLIMTELMDDAVVDHSATRVVLDWIDYSGFTALLDSNGNAWNESLSITLKRGQTYLHVLGALNEFGYEWSLTPKAVAIPSGGPSQNLTHDLNIYNPGGAGSDFSATPTPALNLGQGTIAGPVGQKAIGANTVHVEGSAGQSTRSSSAASVANIGRRETYVGDQDLTGTAAVASRASAELAAQIEAGFSVQFTIAEGPWSTPLRDYDVGDTLRVVLPEITTPSNRRIASIQLSESPSQGLRLTVHANKEQFRGEAGIAQGVKILLEEFKGLDDPFQPVETDITGGGGMMTVAVAASNASSMSQAKADILCDGVDDQVQINEAIQICADAQGGTVWLSEGTFGIDGLIDVSGQQINLRGLGIDTILIISQDLDPTINVGTSCRLLDMTIRGIIS